MIEEKIEYLKNITRKEPNVNALINIQIPISTATRISSNC
jgi:hypothetical protein